MYKEEIAPGIVIYKNIIEDPNSLIEEIEECVARGVTSWVYAGVKTDKTDSINLETRDTLTIGIPYIKNSEPDLSSPQSSFRTALSKTFYDSFTPIEKDYQNSFGINVNSHDYYGILKYGVGQKFTNHIDDHPEFHRRVSFVYYMNDDYEGGEINFPRFNISYKPLANEMIVFPSTYVYNHSVSEVTQGTRYSVVSWMR